MKSIKVKEKELSRRRQARLLAIQSLYASEFTQGRYDSLLLQFLWVETPPSSEISLYAVTLYHLSQENAEEIDLIIKKHLKKWSFERLNRVDLCILRVGICELHYQPEVPSAVILNEALEIAKLLGSPQSSKFINGILDSVKKEVRE